MRMLVASLVLAAACGGPKSKTETSIVPNSEVPDHCCCKTIPETAEKEIVPVYAQMGRMECSTKQGECVDDVQCNGSQQPASTSTGPGPGTGEGQGEGEGSSDTGVPPPPNLGSGGDSTSP